VSQAVRRALVIKHGALGDIFLILGALQDIAEATGAPVDVLTMSPYVKIFKRSPHVNRVFVDNRQSRLNPWYLCELRRMFSDGAYDQIIDLQNSKRTLFYRKFIAPKLNWCQLGMIPPTEFVSQTISSPVLAKAATQLGNCSIGTENLLRGDLEWLCDDSEAVSRVSESRCPVILLPGASAAHTHKIWPRYAELAELLIKEGVDVFVAPGPDDMELCKSISGRQLLSGERWLDFFQLAGVLAKAKFVVGNDSGPTHLAASLGTKGVALFSQRTSQYAPNMARKQMGVMVSNELSEISAESILDLIKALD